MIANVGLLAVSQALLLTTVVGGMAVSALAGRALTADPSLATMPVAALLVGPFLTSWPASMFMERFGRRAGFILGGFLAVIGGALAAAGIAERDFWLFTAGHLFIGAFQGFGNYYRFAAMEAANEQFRHRAMSWVIAAGVVAAFAGPALAHATRPLGPVEFLGTYAAMAVLGILSAGIVSRLRMKRPQVTHADAASARPLTSMIASYPVIAAVATGSIGYAVMILAMTATPLAMADCGLGMESSRSVIQWHVLGMFAPSFFTGRIIQKFGAPRVAMAGLVLLMGHILVAVSGSEMLQFTSALVLLGIGWNFTFLGGTAMLAQTHSPAERAKVQAINEFMVFGLSAFASLSAGWLLTHVGWATLNLILLVPLAVVALILLPLVASLRCPMMRSAPQEGR
ncbi:MAG: MFS transporter [Alphaproteobacteria bacterium]|nr:MFS transporter [Alphaproteobacteria bacterium]